MLSGMRLFAFYDGLDGGTHKIGFSQLVRV